MKADDLYIYYLGVNSFQSKHSRRQMRRWQSSGQWGAGGEDVFCPWVS